MSNSRSFYSYLVVALTYMCLLIPDSEYRMKLPVQELLKEYLTTVLRRSATAEYGKGYLTIGRISMANKILYNTIPTLETSSSPLLSLPVALSENIYPSVLVLREGYLWRGSKLPGLSSR